MKYANILFKKGQINMLRGIDISHWNEYRKNVLENVLDDPVVEFIIAKATQGAIYTDPMFSTNMKTFNKVELLGAYHYLTDADVDEQIANFIKKVKSYENLMLCLDVEDESLRAYYDGELCEIILEFRESIRRELGKELVIYISDSFRPGFLRGTDCPLWVARWGTKPVQRGDGNIVMMQWTNKGYIPAFNGGVDLDIFFGDRKDWEKYATVKKEIS